MKNKLSTLILFFTSIMMTSLYAQPSVLSSNGESIPMSTYTQNLSTPNFTDLVNDALKNNTFNAPTSPVFLNLPLFPLLTQNLTPGKVLLERVNYPGLSQAFFIIGTDATSLQWLANYHTQLKKINAEGFVVNIHSEQELKSLYSEVTDMGLIPINGTKLATRFNLTHYPVLVSKTLIEQ